MIDEEVWGKTISLLSIVAMSTLVKVWNYYWKECSLGRNAATVDIRLWKSRHTIDNDLYLEGSPFQAQFGHFLLNFLTLHFSHPNSLSKSTSINLCNILPLFSLIKIGLKLYNVSNPKRVSLCVCSLHNMTLRGLGKRKNHTNHQDLISFSLFWKTGQNSSSFSGKASKTLNP